MLENCDFWLSGQNALSTSSKNQNFLTQVGCMKIGQSKSYIPIEHSGSIGVLKSMLGITSPPN